MYVVPVGVISRVPASVIIVRYLLLRKHSCRFKMRRKMYESQAGGGRGYFGQ